MKLKERSLKVLIDWNESEGQSAEKLQNLIISALRNQDMITRYVCANAVKTSAENVSVSDFKSVAIANCIKSIAT